MYFSVIQLSLVLLNLAVFNCLEKNEFKILFIKMVPKLVDSNCLDCRITPERPKLETPKYSEEYFTKEPSVRYISYAQLKRLIGRLKLRKSDENEQLKHKRLVPEYPRHLKYLPEESKSQKFEEYIKILRNEWSTRSHGLGILGGKPRNKRTNEILRKNHKIKHVQNESLPLKSLKLNQFLKYLRNGTLEAKSPMMTGFLRRHHHRGGYRTLNSKDSEDSKDGKDLNHTDKDLLDLERDFEVKPEGFFDKIKEKFIDFMELLTGGNYLSKIVRRK